MILANPFRRAVVLNGLFQTSTRFTYREGRVRLIASYNSTFPAPRLRLCLGGSFLSEDRRRKREGKYQRKQQREVLLQHVFLLIPGDDREDVICKTNTRPKGP